MASAPKLPIRALILVESSESGPLPKLAGQLDLSAREGLHSAIVGRATDWAASIAASQPVQTDINGLVPAAEGAEAIVVLRPALIRYGKDLGADLLSDFAAGSGLVLGPTLTGGWYLLGLSPLNLDLIKAAGDGGPKAAGGLLAASRDFPGLEPGLLRAERDLASEADLLAARADPLVDLEVARLIS
jgi:hypothetical protein